MCFINCFFCCVIITYFIVQFLDCAISIGNLIAVFLNHEGSNLIIAIFQVIWTSIIFIVYFVLAIATLILFYRNFIIVFLFHSIMFLLVSAVILIISGGFILKGIDMPSVMFFFNAGSVLLVLTVSIADLISLVVASVILKKLKRIYPIIEMMTDTTTNL